MTAFAGEGRLPITREDIRTRHTAGEKHSTQSNLSWKCHIVLSHPRSHEAINGFMFLFFRFRLSSNLLRERRVPSQAENCYARP